jgi:error-prone DNA polymerase
VTFCEEDGYAELHIHSNFSFLDGVSDPHELVEEGERLGLFAMALTDHNGLYGVVKFSKAARGSTVVPVYGAEVAISTSQPRSLSNDPEGSHLVILAKSPAGYSDLSSVLTEGHMRSGKKGVFDLTLSDLARFYSKEWIVLTGCRKGPLSKALIEKGPSAVSRELSKLIEVFGKDNLAVECWDHGDPIDYHRNKVFVEQAVRFGVRAVATGNVHYATPKAAKAAQVASAVRASKTLTEIEGWLPAAPMAYLRSASEQRRRFKKFPTLVDNTLDIARECAFDLRLVSPDLPKFSKVKEVSEDEYLAQLVEQLAPLRYGNRSDERVKGAYQQIDYELKVIKDLGFAGYFLVVWDVVQYCRSADIFCQGRGSAANSAVCYALGITNVDPVSLRLLFERFLSSERDGPPDIDVDIESGKREQVIQYIYSKYTREMAAQVANVITYRSRSVIRDVGRAFGYEEEVIDSWGKSLDRRGSLSRQLEEVDIEGSPIVSVPKDVSEIALELEHNPRHLGVHPGGMVICDRPIRYVCPTEWARKENRSVLQWDKEDCAEIGLVKFDLLGLGMLSALHETIDLIERFYGVVVDLALLPQEEEVYEMLSKADTVGVFQVESRAQMATLPRLKPREFYDLVVEVALIRPGPIQGGSVHPYIRRRNGLEEVTYLHPLLKNSLSKTLGVPLFQEQLMQMAIDVADFSPQEADLLRQAMGSKRSSEKMERLKKRFYEGMKGNGITGEVADQIFSKMAAFASFGFPESHSASFAYLVYASAWLKLHYPAAFCAGLLRSQPMGFWSPNTLVADARRHGVKALPPMVGLSEDRCSLEPLSGSCELALRLGLDQVHGVGGEVAKKIADNGPYRSVTDLARRCLLNEGQISALAKAGALEFIDHGRSRRQSLWGAKEVSLEAKDGRLFAEMEPPPELPQLSLFDRYVMDISSVGVVVDGHPMDLIRSLLGDEVVTSKDLLEIESGSKVIVAGVVTHRQRPGTAKGVTFLSLEDEFGLMNIVCSVGVWKRYRSVARFRDDLVITGKLERQETVVNIVAHKIEPLAISSNIRPRNFH